MQMLADKRAFCLSPKGNSTTSDWRRKCSPPFMSVAVGIMGISGNALRQTAHYTMINIGQLIQNELRAQGRSTKWLAEQCDIHQRKIQRIMKQVSIDTTDLFKICTALGVDFFYHFSHELHFSVPPRKETDKE